jgi:hypothetical protein
MAIFDLPFLFVLHHNCAVTRYKRLKVLCLHDSTLLPWLQQEDRREIQVMFDCIRGSGDTDPPLPTTVTNLSGDRHCWGARSHLV